jgi:uncharacterized membrane protein
MGILFGLLSALSYGISDFAAGVGSRRMGANLVAGIVQFFSLVAIIIGVFLFPGNGPSKHALLWGAVSGLGSAGGTLALYRGLAVGQMSVVSPLSAVTSAVIPVIVGLFLGDHLSILSAVGIIIAVPAIILVSRGDSPAVGENLQTGIAEGLLSGMGFALLFIALDQAGTQSGAWPLIPGQAIGLLILFPFAWRKRRRFSGGTSSTSIIVGAGLAGGLANLFFLTATGRGQLSIIAILTSLYPALTIILARFILGERWSFLQTAGLCITAAAIVLISLG